MHESEGGARHSFLRHLVRSWVEGSLYECAVARVSAGDAEEGSGQEQHFVGTCGAQVEALFDLASLTKPLLATALLWECARGRLDLDEPVFPGRLGDTAPTLERLLRHNGGARPWWPLYAESEEREGGGTLIEGLLDRCHWGRELGVYSDLGMMCAARWCEYRTGFPVLHSVRSSLSVLLPEITVAEGTMPGLRLDRLGGAHRRAVLVPCSLNTDKEVELAASLSLTIAPLGPPAPGWPQDGNARHVARAGGVAGHAGLAGSAEAVLRLGRLWLAVALDRPLPGGVDESAGAMGWRELASRALDPVDGRRLCWFDGARSPLSATSFGHTGFTGGCLWIDPSRSMVAAVVGNRSDSLSDLGPARRDFLRLAVSLSGRE